MRTNIEIDDKLMRQAMKATGTKTKKAAVESSLRTTIDLKAQEAIRKLRGKVVWRGHDDDWLACDDEVLKRHEEGVKTAAPNRPKSREAA